MTRIRLADQLSAEEAERARMQLFGWSQDIFGTAHLKLTYRPKDPRDRRFILYAQNSPVSHVAVIAHNARANGKDVLIGGIGGVVTVPSVRNQGYAAKLVSHATAFLRDEWNADFALLFCIDRMVAYYERLGWRKVACEVLLEQPTGAIRCPFNVMSIPFKPEFTTIESLDLASASW
jgi:GNAT superfamily N-acetyltransferase